MKSSDRAINVAEQTQELTLLLYVSMKPQLRQHSFLWSPSYLTTETHLISFIAQCFADDLVQCQQAEGYMKRLIVSTALGVSNLVLVVVTDADILVMLVNQISCTHGHGSRPGFLCQRSCHPGEDLSS